MSKTTNESTATTSNVSKTISCMETSSPSVNNSIPKGYYVWSESCKMPKLDPFSPDAMKVFKRRKSLFEILNEFKLIPVVVTM